GSERAEHERRSFGSEAPEGLGQAGTERRARARSDAPGPGDGKPGRGPLSASAIPPKVLGWSKIARQSESFRSQAGSQAHRARSFYRSFAFDRSVKAPARRVSNAVPALLTLVGGPDESLRYRTRRARRGGHISSCSGKAQAGRRRRRGWRLHRSLVPERDRHGRPVRIARHHPQRDYQRQLEG